MSNQIRILPITIFFAALLLSVKVSDVWRGIAHINTTVAVSESRAQTAPLAQPTQPVQAQQTAPAQPIGQAAPGQAAAPQAAAGPPGAATPAPAAGQARAAAPAAGTPAAPVPGAPMQPAAGQKTASASDKPLDPILFSQSEIELLQNLAARRKEIDQREQEVKQREVLLAAAEKRLEGKIGELKDVQTQIEGLIRKYNAQEETEIKRLVTIYEGMKPKDAARIFDQLDLKILLGIIERMREAKSSPIIAQMTPERAKEITTQIAQRREMPALKQ